MAGRKAVQAPNGANEVFNCLSGVLREKASTELNHLNLKLDDGLRHDIARAYSECLFSDLTLIFHTTCIRTHKSLLQTRAPSFYRELLLRGGTNKKTGLADRLTVQLIETFIRELYSKNAIKHKEDAVVAQIRVISCCKDAVDNSPESDIYVTPKASPSEAPCSRQSIGEGRSRYYNIAHIEEDFERELAEQDALSSSFLSIITKEEEEQRSREPTTLDFTKEPPPPPPSLPQKAPVEASSVVPVTLGQCVDQDIVRRRALALKQLNKQLTYSLHSSEEVVVEMKDKQPAGCVGGLMEEATSSSACLDALTSGYVTGGSPKGTDSMTEVASSGEMPHDDDYPSNDEGSSVSSDQGTWDTFPTHDEPTYVERENEIKTETLNKQNELSTNNFFIDASSLIDENEIPSPPSVQPISTEKNGPSPTVNGTSESADPLTPPPSTTERSLIRRNTFEFDPDDEKLKALKEEYDKNSAVKEDHSPDSLNNDITGESFADGEVSKVVKEEDNSSPRYLGCNVGASEMSNSNSSWSSSTRRETDTTDETTSLRDHLRDRSSCSYFNKLESIPIVSGAAPPSDHSGPGSDVSLTSSPLVNRRRNEHAPILSGAAPLPPNGGSDSDCGASESKNGRNSRSGASSLNASWIVDMSDVGSKSSLPSESWRCAPSRKQRVSNGMGFFVPFDDPFPSLDSATSLESSSNRSGCGFYVDLKDLDSKDSSLDKQNSLSISSNPEKKLFSMFIDIGDTKESSSAPRSKPSSPFLSGTRRAKPANPLLSVQKVKSTSTSSDSGLDCAEHASDAGGGAGSRGGSSIGRNQLFDSSVSDSSTTTDSAFSTKRQSFYMFIEAEEPPVTRRKTLPSGVRHSANRHSWNSDKNEMSEVSEIKPYKRSGSVSCDSSSLRLELVRPSSELSRLVQNGAYKDQDVSMEKTGEETTSEAESSVATTTTTDHRTFVVDDVSKAVNVSSGGATDLDLSTPSRDGTTDLSGTATEHEATPTLEEPANRSCQKPQKTGASGGGGFVKLSDMDVLPSDTPLWTAPLSTTVSAKSSRMTRSIPSESGSWLDSKLMANSASSRSLSRLFPHLHPRKALEASDDYSNHSSSLQSSSISPLEVSSEAISDESAGPGTGDAAISRLGQDLLRMFLDGISPDVTLDVAGRRIKAHKCILSSRCQYFAGMLSGGWVESAGNVISLQGFSYNAVHFALCHIYSGASNIPDTINIVELATLADMLCLEGLKEVIMYTLKVKYCHFFHKPCPGCTAGILECLPLAAAYGLDEIYRKSLKWITRYFVKIWPTKGFASLPKELRDKCFKQHIIFLSSETVLDTIMGCEKLDAAKSNVRWAQPVVAMIAKLQEAATKYLTDQFASVLGSEAFASIGKQDVWTMTRLEETLLNCSKSLSPDQSCQSYKKIKQLLKDIRDEGPMDESEWKMEFLELLTQLEISVEDCLVRQAGRAARTVSWSQLDLTLRKKIQEKACLVFAPGPRSSSLSKASESRFGRSSYSDKGHTRAPASETATVRSSASLTRTKMSSPSAHRAATSSTRAPRPATAQSSTSATAPASQHAKQSSHGPSSSGSSAATKRTSPRPTRTANKWTQSSGLIAKTPTPPPSTSQPPPRPKVNPKLAQVKSRYLEPLKRQSTKGNEVEQVAAGRSSSVVSSSTRRFSSGGRALSSSDSSRNSSPATTARSVRSRPSTAGARSKVGAQLFNNSTHDVIPSIKSIPNNRSSTLRASTKASQAKMGPPKTHNTASSTSHNNNNANRHPLITARSSTFLKESSVNAPNKKSQISK